MIEKIKIAVVIATHNRPFELANRSLRSVSEQTVLPDYLVVVDDSDPKYQDQNHSILHEAAKRHMTTKYLKNYRTAGACGAWNTALSWLWNEAPDIYVAILDDDDEWMPEYLEVCSKFAFEKDLDMVIPGLIRHDDKYPEGRNQTIPDRLDANEILGKKSHIQGSNLFIRLRTILMAGGFDEALTSTTDRDLCIRLADLGMVRTGSLDRHLVHHYAFADSERLSTKGSEKKKNGLLQFLDKYRKRMTEAQFEDFLERSETIFGLKLTKEEWKKYPIEPKSKPHAKPNTDNSQLDLIVGTISSPDLNLLKNLLTDLGELVKTDSNTKMTVLILENSGRESTVRKKIKSIPKQYQSDRLAIRLISREVQQQTIDSGLITDIDEDKTGRKSTSVSRTLLQHYLYEEGQLHPGSMVWILDDDSRTNNLLYQGESSIFEGPGEILQNIRRLRGTDISIAIGTITGDPPLPFTSCIRTQMVDLYHNLEWMANREPEEPLPEATKHNMDLRKKHHDFYYDLSRRETDHLETPFAFQTQSTKEDVRSAFKRMASAVPDILSGRELFRPLVDDATGDPFERTLPSIHRGGNAIILHLSALRDYPNPVPRIDGRHTRRNEMVWCLLNKFVGGRKIIEVPIPVRQDRIPRDKEDPDFDKLARDMHGYAMYSSLHDIFKQKADILHYQGKDGFGPKLHEFNDADIELGKTQFEKYLRERCTAFELSYLRIMGLVQALKKYYQPESSSKYWWFKDQSCLEAIESLRKFNEKVQRIYTLDNLQKFKESIQRTDTKNVLEFFKELRNIVKEYKNHQSPITKAFKTFVKDLLMKKFEVKDLTYIGHGEEGIVFTDSSRTFKYLYHWKRLMSEKDIEFVIGKSRQVHGLKTIYPYELIRWDAHKVIVYPYEPSQPYTGGHLDDILTFLRECRANGLVFDNVHPNNFRITKQGLRLIDYGWDLGPYTEDDFEQMCRRAYLMYRFPFHPKLKELMTKSLKEPAMPELYHFEYFKRALDPRGMTEILYTPLLALLEQERGRRVLDYGCGKGELAESLSKAGHDVTAYDIDLQLIALGKNRKSSVRYIGPNQYRQERKKSGKYDLVVCNLVLCAIPDDKLVMKVLTDLKMAVSEKGSIFIGVCNPFFIKTERTELATKIKTQDADYGSTFAFKKLVHSSRNERTDIHRPFGRYLELFSKVGLTVDEIRQTEGIDTKHFLPASDYLIFKLRPKQRPNDPKVSLLIKTCAMEWEWIEKGVRHLVKQLETPTPFCEKVIVTDGYSKDFLRQYRKPDHKRFKAALDRLLKDGIVDKIVYAPYDPLKIKKMNKKWFGLDTAATYAQNGQNVYPTLFGLESCKGDYILQVDSDLLIGRKGPVHDYLNEMVDVLKADQKAITVAFNILHEDSVKYSPSSLRGPWRVEVRNCLFDRERLLSALPLPNELAEDKLELAWHRALDKKIKLSGSHSYRGGDKRTFFIHVPNNRKKDPASLFYIMDRVEDSFFLPEQDGNVDLVGGLGDWAGPKRTEPFIFIICARNVGPGKFKDCWNSILSQDLKDWGAVIIDGASGNGLGDYIEMLVRPFKDKVTFVREKDPKGLLFSTWLAITHFCSNKESVIITLDADDALIGRKVLDRVKQEYDNGADATVGTMLRTDKFKEYPPDLKDPRSHRGGNVWQHLRTFRKYLFDKIKVEDLQLDGEWIDIATDWAFMLPIIEMARNPKHIEDVLYFYEPSAQAPARRKIQEQVIKKIVAKKRYNRIGAEELPSTLGISKVVSNLSRESKMAEAHVSGRSKARIKFKGQRGLRLHWGCGERHLTDWVNIDIMPGADLLLDLREEWPFGNGSVKEVFMEHVLEHLEYPDEVEHVLLEIYRVLEPDGRLRLGVPDTEWPIQAYREGPEAEYFKLCKSRWHPKELKTRMEHINYHFRGAWGEHKYAYDEETLRETLKKQGFHNIERSKFDKRTDSRRRAKGTLYMTAIKPSYR